MRNSPFHGLFFSFALQCNPTWMPDFIVMQMRKLTVKRAIARQISTPLFVLHYGHTTLLKHDGKHIPTQKFLKYLPGIRKQTTEKFKPLTFFKSLL